MREDRGSSTPYGSVGRVFAQHAKNEGRTLVFEELTRGTQTIRIYGENHTQGIGEEMPNDCVNLVERSMLREVPPGIHGSLTLEFSGLVALHERSSTHRVPRGIPCDVREACGMAFDHSLWEVVKTSDQWDVLDKMLRTRFEGLLDPPDAVKTWFQDLHSRMSTEDARLFQDDWMDFREHVKELYTHSLTELDPEYRGYMFWDIPATLTDLSFLANCLARSDPCIHIVTGSLHVHRMVGFLTRYGYKANPHLRTSVRNWDASVNLRSPHTRDKKKKLHMDRLLNMTFIHIPKTGGTTIENSLTSDRAIIHRYPRPPSDPWLSPWHFPPDLYEQRYLVPYDRPGHKQRFCVVRHPAERYASCERYTKSGFQRPAMSLASDYLRWHGIEPTEEHLHRMPQHMFVFDRKGHVQCQCVISFDKLGRLLRQVDNKSQGPRNITMPRDFAELYRHDLVLYEKARRHPELCYNPFVFHHHLHTHKGLLTSLRP